MILASHQPDFLPYPGFFYKLLKSDVFVFSDDVQYSKSELHKYNFIKGANGRQRIAVPVSFDTGDLICDVRIADDDRLIQKMIDTIVQAYSKAPYFDEVIDHLIPIIEGKGGRGYLASMNANLIKWIARNLGIKTPILWASQLHLSGHKDDRIVALCNALGCNEYYSGTGAAAYHSRLTFAAAGIRLTYSDYKPILYPQQYGEFEENLSMLDYIFNCGFELPKEWRGEARV